jgi:hypothetical protein
MTRKELNALKAKIAEKKEKASDLDVIVTRVMALPYGQLKKVLTSEVLAVLEKYGYSQ